MSLADDSWSFSHLTVAWAIYIVVAGLIAVIGMKLWGKEATTKAKFESWRKSSERDLAIRAKGIGLGFSMLGLPLGVMVDTLAKMRQLAKSEKKPQD